MMGQAPIQTTDPRVLCASSTKPTWLRRFSCYFQRDTLLFRGGVVDCSCLLSPYSPQSHAIVVLVRQLRGHAYRLATAVWKPCRFLSLREGSGPDSLSLCRQVSVRSNCPHHYRC